ncbi:hypothetical protein M409DRAFT_50430 [Zasmidium cellare ATCC 36951]|uniref:YTH domain-containing protein n=1 Tax=Zasmidium cellare ATCC 36951 TaxID=1080233 RepID=A0A6A6CX42_ZASCE|nr:uncharacterized protein M409DRAFT_50430 [Zasmidium cellare ATCC 36951]KAF2171787.1 hypothetical protein M409DRAFT_50430 [Zasmidium cellare ATCC 36951]
MDWNNPMAVFGFPDDPQPSGGEVDDENDNFYDDANPNDDAHPGAPQPSNHDQNVTTNMTPKPISQAEKDRNQKRAEMLRAKLLAQRQNTPSKAASRSGTPAQMNPQPVEAVSSVPIAPSQPIQTQSQTNNPIKEEVKEQPKPSSNISPLEALLDHGKALADEKAAALAASENTSSATADDLTKSAAPAENHQKPTNTNATQEAAQWPYEHSERSTNLSDSYYADLPAWLEITGFHDVEFRTSKLSTYKERKALEEEAARIAEKLEKLKQAEQEAMQSLRMATPKPSATTMAPPPLPATMPKEMATPKVNGTNGTKRGHSPASLPPEKMRRLEDNSGFRIRGANDSPLDSRPPPLRRPRTPSPADLERRISYPDARRPSVSERKGGYRPPGSRGESVDAFLERKGTYRPPGSRRESRDSSLERRQSYYREEGEIAYDSYTPYDPPPRLPFSNTRNNSNTKAPQYRGSVLLDLRKGGVRYFLIKSWNHENVIAAQRENLWATQEKNEDLLAEACKTSRHVILLFSVNKSMAFQGYALMTSPPDPKMPKPAFASKLNWGTSAAFSLRWLGTTSIHFRLIGHLKNTLNKDEKGESRAVLIGKDGQEVSADAGMGVVWALDEAEATANEKENRR